MAYKNIITERHPRWRVSANLIMENNYKYLAEIGVSRGDHPREISRILKGEKYRIERFYLIDIEERKKRLYTVDSGNTKIKMFQLKSKGLSHCTYWEMGSELASKTLLDNTLDFVFLDADTSKKEYMKKDIHLWYPKLVPGGILAGRYLVFEDKQPTSYMKDLINDTFGNHHISLHLLEEQCSGKDDYYWWYQK